MSSIDLAITIFREVSIVNESKKSPVPLIVDTKYERVISEVNLEEFVAFHERHVELNLFKGYFLSHACLNAHILNIVILVWSVHHCRDIIHVSLLRHTSIDSKVSIA